MQADLAFHSSTEHKTGGLKLITPAFLFTIGLQALLTILRVHPEGLLSCSCGGLGRKGDENYQTREESEGITASILQTSEGFGVKDVWRHLVSLNLSVHQRLVERTSSHADLDSSLCGEEPQGGRDRWRDVVVD